MTNNKQCIDHCVFSADWLRQIAILVRKMCFIVYSRIVYSKLQKHCDNSQLHLSYICELIYYFEIVNFYIHIAAKLAVRCAMFLLPLSNVAGFVKLGQIFKSS